MTRAAAAAADTQQFSTGLQMSTHCLPRNLDTALVRFSHRAFWRRQRSFCPPPTPLCMAFGASADSAWPQGLLAAVVGETGFESSEEDRIETLVTSGATGMVESLQGSGHSYASKLAAAPLSPGNTLSNQLYGLPAVMYAAKLSAGLNPAAAADDRAELHAQLRDAMRLVGQALLHNGGLRCAAPNTPPRSDSAPVASTYHTTRGLKALGVLTASFLAWVE